MKLEKLIKYKADENFGNGLVYSIPEVNQVLDEKDAEIAELKKKLMPCLNGDCILTCEVVEKYGKENAELKAKLENVQASAYAESVDAGMRERRLRRALWLSRAERAKEHLWHDVNPEGSPKEDYTGHDWVFVQLRETGGFELIPRVAEYRRHLKRWVFIDENYDTENSHEFRYLRDKCVVIGWRDIDFAYYGKKFFVQQEINKNVERKCRAMAEKFK
jgi:hypothetical protein